MGIATTHPVLGLAVVQERRKAQRMVTALDAMEAVAGQVLAVALVVETAAAVVETAAAVTAVAVTAVAAGDVRYLSSHNLKTI